MTCLTYDLHLYILKTVVADSRESARPVTCFPWSVQTRCGSLKVMPVDRGADYDAPSEGLQKTSELFGISPSTASTPGRASRQDNLCRHGWRPQTDPAVRRQRLGFRNCSASLHQPPRFRVRLPGKPTYAAIGGGHRLIRLVDGNV